MKKSKSILYKTFKRFVALYAQKNLKELLLLMLLKSLK